MALPEAGYPSHTVSPGLGAMQSTIAWINARGVKYWPAPLLVSCAFDSRQEHRRQGKFASWPEPQNRSKNSGSAYSLQIVKPSCR